MNLSKIFLLLLCFAATSLNLVLAQNKPIIVELENTTLGTEFSVLSDGATNYISVANNSTGDLPESINRIATMQVTFPEAGEYDLYIRCRVGPNGANDDSFFYGNGFGVKSLSSAEEWIRSNGLSAVGYTTQNEVVDGGGGAGQGVWKWINISEFMGDEPPLKFTINSGELTQTFQIGAREDGFDMDKIAFGKADLKYTSTNLDKVEEGGDGTGGGSKYKPIAEGKEKYLGNIFSTNQLALFINYWNQVSPENAGKWGSVEGQRDVMNWTQLDAAYALAKNNGFPFKFHVLIWGNQQPAWIENLPQKDQYEEIVEWFAAVAERYPDIDYVEVVNEPTNDPPFSAGNGGGNYGPALGGNGATGWDWIIESYTLARTYFPRAKLLINEYNIVNNDSKTTTYLGIINLLKARNLIDQIGVQAHAFSTKGSATQMSGNLDRLGATGLPIYVTEMEIDGATDAVQLQEYKRVFPIFWEHPSVKGITLWGWRTGLWRNDQRAFLMAEDGLTERPALIWLREYVANSLTATKEIKSSHDFQVYPNPIFGDLLYIDGPNVDQLTTALIFDLNGRLVEKGNIVNQNLSIKNELANGIYILHLQDSLHTYTKKIVVSK